MDSQEITPLSPGDQLYEWRIEKVLGQGGFGITYLGCNVSTGERVVIKENIPGINAVRPQGDKHFTLNKDDMTTNKGGVEWSRSNFIREATSLAKLNHPGVVKVLTAFESEETHTQYYVMPYVESTSLGAALKKNVRPSYEWAHYMLSALLHTLSYVHQAGMLHRDIKPDNILIQKDGKPVLIDFGSARATVQDTHTRIVSEDYSPIEQVRGGGEGPWTDIYALGATFYRTLTGECVPRPVERLDNQDTYVPLASRKELVSRFGYPMLAGIDHALEFEPQNRYQSADEWIQAMSGTPGFQDTESVPLLVRNSDDEGGSTILMSASDAPTPTKKTKTQQKKEKKSFWLLLLIIIILLLLALLGWWLFNRSSGDDDKVDLTTVPVKGPESDPQPEQEPDHQEEPPSGVEQTSGSDTEPPPPPPTPEPTMHRKRLIVRPTAKLYNADGTEVIDDTTRTFAVYYVMKECEDRYIVTPLMDGTEPVGAFKKEDVYEWTTNLAMKFTNLPSVVRDSSRNNADPLCGRDRSLFFRDAGAAKRYISGSLADRKDLLGRVEEAMQRRRSLKETPEELRELENNYGVVGIEPVRQGVYLLPLLNTDNSNGKVNKYTYGNNQTARGKIRTSIVEVAAMTAPATVKDTTKEINPAPDVDVVFVIDTSRSMRPYIDDVRELVGDMADRIREKTKEGQVMFGLVGYRDWKATDTSGLTEDEGFTQRVLGYKVKNFNGNKNAKMFSRDEFQLVLEQLEETTGDSIDYHEDLIAGLTEAARNMPWRGADPTQAKNKKSGSIRLIILIGDAPCREDLPGGDPYNCEENGREVNALSLGSPYWKYRARGSATHYRISNIKNLLKDMGIYVESYFIPTLPKKPVTEETFARYLLKGKDQFSQLDHRGKCHIVNVNDLSKSAPELVDMWKSQGVLDDQEKVSEFKATLQNSLTELIDMAGEADIQKPKEGEEVSSMHHIFADAYVDWLAHQEPDEAERLDMTAWMPDKSFSNMEAIKAHVVLTREQLSIIAEKLKAILDNMQEDKEDALSPVAEVLINVLTDPNVELSTTKKGADNNAIRDEIQSLPYTSNIIAQLKAGNTKSETDRQNDLQNIQAALRMYKQIAEMDVSQASFIIIPDPKGDHLKDSFIIPVDQLP